VSELDGRAAWIAAPIFGRFATGPENLTAAMAERLPAWRAAGFVRVLIDGVEARLDADLPPIEAGGSVDVVVDRTTIGAATRARIAEAVEQAEALSGRVSVIVRAANGAVRAGGERHEYSSHGACPECGFVLKDELEPRHFSFNTHVGACPACDGLGERVQCDAELLFRHPERTIDEGALHGKLSRYLVKGKGYYENLLRAVAKTHKVDLDRPWRDFSPGEQALIACGAGARDTYKVRLERTTENAEIEEQFSAPWPGLCGHVDAWHAKTEDPEWAAILEQVMSRRTCTECNGERLMPESRAVTLGKLRLPELLELSVADALAWTNDLCERASLVKAVGPVIHEIASRLSLLERVGLGYLTLDRHTSTLSGGEARRVRLSASLGSQLVGVCYVLDEPTVGLHPQDVARLTDALIELRDRGNTVIVVEHDPSLMARADWIVDMGPGAGRNGGSVVVAGTPAEVAAHPGSLTGAALRGAIRLERDAVANARAQRATDEGDEHAASGDEHALSGDGSAPSRDEHAPSRDARTSGRGVRLIGARTHNLKDVDFEFAFGEITGVCGPSGSGKSTLILDTLVPALAGERSEGRWKRVIGVEGGGARAVVVDASPIGRTPASIPATYTGLMEPLRELYARTPEARMKGFDAGRFSFNSPKGRCPACEGRGATKVEMQFLSDLWLVCEECDGKRYAPEVLEVKLRGKSIADALELSVDEACELFAHQPRITSILETLRDVGLGYLCLGQSSTTLSGGEAQRVKLASELFRAEGSGRSVIVLDEPSTGLSTGDVAHLVRVFDRLARNGHAVILVEHHTGLLTICDRLVELGPEGGAGGGRVIATGTPREIEANPESVTGPWLYADPLSASLPPAAPAARRGRAAKRAAPARGAPSDVADEPARTTDSPAPAPTQARRRRKLGTERIEGEAR
jgi:excinuclease ABC subunit A